MLKYLIIMLDDTSVSYCHYQNPRTEHRLMPLDMLKKAIFFAMKENINIQFVYPDYNLPQEYVDAINTIDHTDIVPAGRKGDVVVCSWDNLAEEGVVALRTTRSELFARYAEIADALSSKERINVIVTDLEKMNESDFESYKTVLGALAERVKTLYAEGKSPQLNILTDRMMLSGMNNCNAGWESMTLAPDGKFYVCPAFYLETDGYSVGDLETGLDIKNPQLYQLKYAPICRECDAYHCRRCVCLNRKTTLEVNTPSHEQCVVAHLERNASRNLLASIRAIGQFLPEANIPEINYLDPFDNIDRK